MNYVLYFNLAAIICCGVLLVITNAEHRKVSTIRSNILSMLLVLIMFLAASSIIAWNIEDYVYDIQNYYRLRCFATYIYYILRSGLWGGIFFYFYFLVRPYDKADGKRDIFFFAPFFALLVAFIVNAFTGTVFIIGEDSEFYRGELFWLIYLIDICYAFMIIVTILFRHRKEIGKHKLVPSWAFVVMMLVSAGVHYAYFTLLFECFGFALATIILVMTVQNPREIIDVESTLLNYGCFKEEIYKNINHEREFSMLFLYFPEMDDYRVIYENKIINKLIEASGKALKEIRNNMLAYRIKTNVFVVLYPRAEVKRMETDIKQIREVFGEKFAVYDKLLLMEPILMRLEYPKEVENFEDIMGSVRIMQDKFRYYSGDIVSIEEEAFGRHREKKHLEKIIVKLAKERYIKVSCTPIYNVENAKVEAAYVGISIRDYMEEDMTYEDFLKRCGSNEKVVTIERQLFDIICSMLYDENPALAGARKICITLSNVHFMQDNMVEVINRTMKRYGVSPKAIAFGVSGTVLNNMNYTIESNIERLGVRGIDIFMEEYGVGKANFDSLTNMDVNYVEMDASITESIYENEKYETVMRRQIEVAHKLGTKMLVGGVVDKSQVEKLREMGADYYKLKSL